MDIEYILEKPKNRCTERFIKNHYKSEYNDILNKPGQSFSEKLYNYIYNCPQHLCPICGKETSFNTIVSGYHKYCSVKCSTQDPTRKETIESTCLKKYGVKYTSQVPSIKQKTRESMISKYGGFGYGSQELRNKIEKTTLQKYGTKNVTNLEQCKIKRENTSLKKFGVKSILSLKSIHDKANETMMNKYGTTCYWLTPEYKEQFKKNKYTSREKAKQTMIERYGVDSYSKTDEFAQKCKQTREAKLKNSLEGFIKYDEQIRIMKCPHQECNQCEEKTFEIGYKTYYDRTKLGVEICTKLNPVGDHYKDTSLELFVRNILDEHNIKYECNNRSIISPRELDIYIPELKIGIETNGCFWHSDKIKESKYHINKYLTCSKNNIKLLTLWEDWIINKPEIVKSLLLNKLGLTKNKIYARKCYIKEIDSKSSSQFLRQNHIQGRCNASVHLGLYKDQNLCAVMCFSKRSKLSGSKDIIDGDWELIRFCNQINTSVIGGAGKLLKYFIKKYYPKMITSFSCNDISDGNLYKNLGFEKQGTSQSYWYISSNSMRRYHRTKFTKSALQEIFPDINVKDYTEKELTDRLHLYRIFDCGTTKWTLIC